MSATSTLEALQIPPDAGDPVLAQQQTQFNTLVREVAAWRSALAEWKDRIARYHQAVGPARHQLHAAWREWVFALDHASMQSGLTRSERERLRELLDEAATALLEGEDDPELAALVGRPAQANEAVRARQEDADPAASDGTLPDDAAPDWERDADAAAGERARAAAKRRAAAALKRRKQAAQEVSQSLRQVFRRLASALHPDRELDAHQRARKTALMQQANEAYAQENLLALLELQLQAEQIDAAHLAGVDLRRLQHYVAVLQDQLADLQTETRRLEAGFRAAAGLAPGTGLQPRKADRLIASEARRLQGEAQLVRRQAGLLSDVEATKIWLREQRKA